MNKERIVICLGGGVNDDGSLPLHVKRRVDLVVELIKEGKFDKVVFTTGVTRRKRVLSFESEAMREEAVKQGVSPERIICEAMSRDTFGNAVFARALYIDPKKIKRFSVVTSGFHMEKTKLLFNHVFPRSQNFKINFIEVSDNGINKEALLKRIAHEKFSCQFYKKEILPEVKAGDINNLIIWQLENNPSHTLVKNEKFKKFEEFVNKNFSGSPLY